MMPSESEILYRGTAAGTPDRPSQSHCQGCHSIIDPLIGCATCERFVVIAAVFERGGGAHRSTITLSAPDRYSAVRKARERWSAEHGPYAFTITDCEEAA